MSSFKGSGPSAAAVPPDLYAAIGVASTASVEEIRKAYKRLAVLHHPDKNPTDGGEKFKEIAHAYRVLSDPEQRQTYDLSRRLRGRGLTDLRAELNRGIGKGSCR
eukprot:RCo014743